MPRPSPPSLWIRYQSAVLTADNDFWIAFDDIAAFNEAAARCGLTPGGPPEAARRRGRYVVENDEHVDVLVEPAVPTVDGVLVRFDELWERRVAIPVADGVAVHVPALDDLILTKRFGRRPKDLEDIRLLTILRSDTDR